MFTHAIVRTPCRAIVNGITTASLGKPVYEKAIEQHQQYIATLIECGLKVEVLDANENFPDSTFVEDAALCTKEFAVITNPGASSRQGEQELMRPVLKKYFNILEEIKSPGTLDAGDLMMVGKHFFIGISERTNSEGAKQLVRILEKHNMTGSAITLSEMLHLKTGVSYLENNILLVCGELTFHPAFSGFKKIHVDGDEAYSANAVWINGNVIVPKGFPKTKNKIALEGYKVIEVDVSEFQKVDGGLSCLSLRF
jgi:dimethylargininase